MKRLLISILLVAGLWSQAQATTIAYVVNSVTDTTTGVPNSPTFDKQWIRFFNDQMGYTVKVITDDSASHITQPTAAYDGYFLSATINGANLSNLDTTASGVVICDQLLYDDFRVATGQVSPVVTLNFQSVFNRVDSLHAITKYMFNRIYFNFSGGTGHHAYTGLPDSAHVLFTPSTREWDGIEGTPDTSFCYALEAGVPLTSGTAQGRRVVALSFYGLLTAETDAGWCHPYELMGNICGWAWGDEENQYNANYNCYSTDRASDPGPEVNQGWCEFGGAHASVFANGRTGHDSDMGLMFLQMRYWSKKAMAGYEPDSIKITYKIPYAGYGTDNPPHLYDTVSIVSVNSTTSMIIDSTTRNFTTVSKYDWFFMGSTSYGIVLRSGAGADTTQKGDTCRISLPSSSSNSAAVTYTIGATSTNNSGIWNGTAGGQMILKVADPYGGFDYWLKMYAITPTTPWTAPLAYLNQGGNPEGSATRTWVNRNFIKSGNTDSVRWSAFDLAAGVDHPAAAIDSFRVNKTTLSPDGTSTIDFVLPGSYLNNSNFNWLVFKSIDQTGGLDSTDVEIIPSSVSTVRGTRTQKFEMYLSDASPQTLGVEDTTLVISVVYGVNPSSYYYNQIVNTGDGAVQVDSIVDNQSWLYVVPPNGVTPFYVNHVIDTTGFGVATDTATVLVYASGADNTPLTYYVIYSQTAPPVETPAATIEKVAGLRLQ